MANFNKILKLLIDNLSNKNPGIKGLHNYSKKVPELHQAFRDNHP